MLAENLKRLREAKGYSKAELARQTGIAHQVITHYEAGRNAIGIVNLAKIARALECRPQDIDERADGLGDAPAERQNIRKINNKILLEIVDTWDDFSGVEQAEIGAVLANFKKKQERTETSPRKERRLSA